MQPTCSEHTKEHGSPWLITNTTQLETEAQKASMANRIISSRDQLFHSPSHMGQDQQSMRKAAPWSTEPCQCQFRLSLQQWRCFGGWGSQRDGADSSLSSVSWSSHSHNGEASMFETISSCPHTRIEPSDCTFTCRRVTG